MPNLPCEILDHIVGFLHNSQTPFRNCCLVSKSWIPRARTHLFAEVRFRTADSLESWKKTFPRPSTSPTRYTKTLFIYRPQVVTVKDVQAGYWVNGFPRLVGLVMVGGGQQWFPCGWGDTFALFHGISPVLKSLRVGSGLFPSSQLFDLIFSFPLLEDLSITDCYHHTVDFGKGFGGLSTRARPSSSPMFSGSLELELTRRGGMEPIGHRLLPALGDMHFRKLILKSSYEEDIPLMTKLVEKCSHTLKSLDITHNNSRADPRSTSFNLSKATRLEDVVFQPGSVSVEWITLALRAITPKHRDLRRISVVLPHHLAYTRVIRELRQALGEGVLEQWLDLDRTLVHLWELLSTRTNFIWLRARREGALGDHVGRLLPEMVKRGMLTADLLG